MFVVVGDDGEDKTKQQAAGAQSVGRYGSGTGKGIATRASLHPSCIPQLGVTLTVRLAQRRRRSRCPRQVMAGLKVICDSGPVDMTSSCVRESWSALIPAAFTLLVCVAATPLPSTVRAILRVLKRPFQGFLSLREAEALNSDIPPDDLASSTPAGPSWRTVLLSFLALSETLTWLVIGSYRFATEPEDLWGDLRPFLIAVSWLYATVRPIASPSPTPPYDLFALFLLRTAFDVLAFGGRIYDHTVDGAPLPEPWTFVAYILNLGVLVTSLIIILSMPLAIPSPAIKSDDIVSYQSVSVLIQLLNAANRGRPYLQKTTLRCGVGSLSHGLSPLSTAERTQLSTRVTFGT